MLFQSWSLNVSHVPTYDLHANLIEGYLLKKDSGIPKKDYG